MARLARREASEVIVLLRVDESDVASQERALAAAAGPGGAAGAGPGGAAAGPGGAAAALRREVRVRANAAAKDAIFPRAAGPAPAPAAGRGAPPPAPPRGAMAGGGGARLSEDFEQLPIVLAEVDSPEALAALRAAPSVASAAAPRLVWPQLTESLALINQPEAIEMIGPTSEGCSIVIMDTGVDYTVDDLGNCAAPGAPPPCRVAHTEELARSDDGVLDDLGHGTNVASIAASAAPGARIISLDIFDNIDGRIGAYESSIVRGYNWVLRVKGAVNVCAVNLSLGGGSFNHSNGISNCPLTPLSLTMWAARLEGVTTVASAGNGGSASGLSWPACVYGVVSVGAVYDAAAGWRRWGGLCTDEATWADRVACFSNTSPTLDLLAPGVFISAGGREFSGTSMAAPHVAAAVAVLKAAAPAATPDEIEAALKASGTPVADPKAGNAAAPRINLAAAVAALTGAAPPPAPPPAAAVILDGGSAWTAARGVGVHVTARGAARVEAMCVGEAGGPPCAFEPFAPFFSFNFSSGDGRNVLEVTLRDAAGNVALAPATAEITLDSSPPGGAALVINGGAASTASTLVDLQINATNAAAMCVGEALGIMRLTCDGAWRPVEARAQFNLSAWEGVKTVYLFLQNAANSSLATPASASITYAPSPPTRVALEINGGSGWAAAPAVSVKLSALSRFGITEACLSNAPPAAGGCAPFVPLPQNGTLPWSLPAGDGNFTVYGVLRNGPLESAPAAASVLTDHAPPAAVSVTLDGGAPWAAARAVALRAAAADVSGVAEICVRDGEPPPAGEGPAPCAPFLKYTEPYNHMLPPGDGPKALRVWLRDAAGNTMAVPAVGRIQLDTAPPAASVRLLGAAGAAAPAEGVPYTQDMIQIEITPGADLSGVTGMRFYDSAASEAAAAAAAAAAAVAAPAAAAAAAGAQQWVPFAAAAELRLAPGEGERRVGVFLRDAAGNEMAAPAAAAVLVDTAPPHSCSVVVTAPNGGAAVAAVAKRRVRLALAASDASGVTHACVTQDPAHTAVTCKPWRKFQRTLKLQLAGRGAGSKLIRAFFRDGAGHATLTPAHTRVVYDPKLRARPKGL
ncbi:MAG: hypothetical protein J3K34DRAFT_517559 [Monoraphidium minutum]|nr:MAG: hypothetical protein J3K34DRAFT_517559 [Monoraphidium minutum]